MVVSEQIGISILMISARSNWNILLEYSSREEGEEEVVERSFRQSLV